MWRPENKALSGTADISVEEADERFIAAARWATDLAMSTITPRKT